MDALRLVQRASPGTNYTAITDYRNQCTIDTCPLSDSYYAYRPSLAANAIFLVLFSFSLVCFSLQAALSRRFIGFTIAIVAGCILEVAGYVGRIISYKNPFDQVCCSPPRTRSLLIQPEEWLLDPNMLSHNCPSVHGCGPLPLPISHCQHVWPRELAHCSTFVPSDLHSVRCGVAPSPGYWGRYGQYRQSPEQESRKW